MGKLGPSLSQPQLPSLPVCETDRHESNMNGDIVRDNVSLMDGLPDGDALNNVSNYCKKDSNCLGN